ncbi:MAG: deoxyribose-phosphate aldolase, partial [Mucinivorans sp.]
VALAIENGADEIDLPIDIGAILSQNFDVAQAEIAAIKEEIGGEALLKVILETGVLAHDQLIYQASMAAMQAGADFIKTSTGKALVDGAVVGATPGAVQVMCRAIKQFHELTGRQVGIKVAGGIRTDQDATLYYNIVSTELGSSWLTPSFFRLGRSSI